MEFTTDQYIAVEEVMKLLSCSSATARRYMMTGYKGIMLKTVKLRSRRLTTREWVAEFAAETSTFNGSIEWHAERSLRPLRQAEELRHA